MTSLNTTASWTAAVRAREHERPDRLFEDPYAADLAGEAGAAWIEGKADALLASIALRTRYFDEFLMRAANDEGIKQVVLPGAGLDTRAYRLKWPAGVTLFELDLAAVLDYKEKVMDRLEARPACERITINIDLSNPLAQALEKASFDPTAPSTWLLEGFLFYLPDDRITWILDQISALASPGSWLGFDIFNPLTLTHPFTKSWVKMQADMGAPWIGTMADPVGELAIRGWKAALSQAGASDANHGRWLFPVFPVNMPGVPHNWFVTAKKG